MKTNITKFIKKFTKITLLGAALFSIGTVSSNAEWVTMNVSAYTGGGITATGIAPYEGIVASDDLPFGTVVHINGQPYVVADRFGGGFQNFIDIYMDSYEEAINFGRQYISVYIER